MLLATTTVEDFDRFMPDLLDQGSREAKAARLERLCGPLRPRPGRPCAGVARLGPGGVEALHVRSRGPRDLRGGRARGSAPGDRGRGSLRRIAFEVLPVFVGHGGGSKGPPSCLRLEKRPGPSCVLATCARGDGGRSSGVGCEPRPERRNRGQSPCAPGPDVQNGVTMSWRWILVPVLVGVVAAVGTPAATRGAAGAADPCRSMVRQDVLPPWMRAGFSEGRPRAPHVVGRAGRIGGVVFGWPLASPPGALRRNKVLWVPRRETSSSTALWIRMQRMEGRAAVGSPVSRVVAGGPGPSIVNAPSPGCWRLTLSWAERRDTLDLVYRSD
jgi:hypothetical protein